VSTIQRLPAFREIYEARLNNSRMTGLRAMKKKLKTASSSRKKTYQRSLANLVQLPSNLRSARTHSVVAMLILAQRQNGEAAWFKRMQKDAQNDAAKLRELLLICTATGKTSNFDIADQLAKLDPDDQLPHTAKFFLMTNRASANINAMSSEQKQQRLESLERSFQWIDQHRPDLRADVLYNYGLQLSWLGDSKLAAELVTQEMNAARRLEELGNLPSLVFQIADPELQAKFLVRIAKLAENADAASASQLAAILQVVIAQPFNRFDGDKPVNAILSSFDRYLEIAGNSTTQANASSSRAYALATARQRSTYQTRRLGTSSAQRQFMLAQQQVLQTQLQSLMTEYRTITQQIAKLQNNNQAKAQLATLTARKSQLLATMQTISRQRSQSNMVFFPAPNDYLAVQAHMILQQLAERVKSIKKSDLLLRMLAVRSGETKGHVHQRYEMARIATLWWADKRSESLKLLTEFCGTVPDDHRLRFALAQASVVNRDLPAALTELNKVETTNDIKSFNTKAVLEQQATALRSSIWQSVVTSGDKSIYDTVLIELSSPLEPKLTVLFQDPARVARASRTTRRASKTTIRQPSTTIRRPSKTIRKPSTPRSPSSRAPVTWKPPANSKSSSVASYGDQFPITKLLAFAHSRDTLPGSKREYLAQLDKLASARFKKYSKNVELAALVTLVRLKRGRGADAFLPGVRLLGLVHANVKLAGRPPATLVTIACLQNADTRKLGYRLSFMSAATGQSQIGRLELLKVLTTSTSAYVADGRTDEAEKLVRELFNDIDRVPTSANNRSADKLYRMAELLPAIHATLLPLALDELAQRYVKNTERMRMPQRFVYPLQEALSKGTSKLSESARKESLKRLVAMLFSQGSDQDAVILWWQSGTGNVMTSSLGKVVIDLANSCGELTRLRKQWDQHPLANSANILALRVEAAVAQADEETIQKLLAEIPTINKQTKMIQKLLAEIPTINKQTKTHVPVWSDRCRKLAFPDRAVAEWVLSQGIGVSVILSPGGIIMQAGDLPGKEFSIRSVVLTARKNVTDESLTNLSRLHELEYLDLSKTAVTDAGLKHLKDLSSLQALGLSHTEITDAGLKHLANLRKLTFLKIQQTKVTEAGIESLKKALPKCRVLH